LFPTTTPIAPDTAFTIPGSAETSSPPKKGVDTDQNLTSSSASKTPKSKAAATVTQAVAPQTALSAAATTLSVSDNGGGHHKKPEGLSPLAEQLLIAAGAIGM